MFMNQIFDLDGLLSTGAAAGGGGTSRENTGEGMKGGGEGRGAEN